MKHALLSLPGIVAAVGGIALATPAAFAQDLAPGLQKKDAASGGKEDVATAGFEAAQKPAEDKDATELKLSAGGLFTGGNSESIAATLRELLRSPERLVAMYRESRVSDEFTLESLASSLSQL